MATNSFQEREHQETRRLALAARLALACLLLIGIASGTGGYRPEDIFFLPCFFRLLFETPCPACGLTRACIAVSQGNPGSAWAFHPLVFPLLLALLAAALIPGRLRTWLKARTDRQRRLMALVFALLVICTWLLRLVSGSIA